MGLWYPKWDPKNSGCLAGTQRMGAVRTRTGVSSARSMSHDDPQILTEPPARIALRTFPRRDEP